MKASRQNFLPTWGRRPAGKGSRNAGASLLSAAFLLAVLAALFLPWPASGSERLPLVIFTVDVESENYEGLEIPLPEQIETVCEGGLPCGVRYMAGTLAEKGYPATFFLDVYEHRAYGKGPLRELARWLEAAGHDVELHTHPQWAYDPERRFMFEYTLEEQKEIVREGKELLESWISRPVVAHRAGAYGADENTLVALIENGIYIDSSLFYRYPFSKIDSLPLKKNAISMYGPLYEIPVTVYVKRESSPVMSKLLRDYPRTRKYDFNWFRDFEEAVKAIDEAEVLGLDLVVFFLHSFTFIEGKSGDGGFRADREVMDTFEGVLALLRARGYSSATFRELAADTAGLEAMLGSPDRIPEISVRVELYRYILRFFRINRSNYVRRGAIYGSGLIALGVILVVLVRRRRADV